MRAPLVTPRFVRVALAAALLGTFGRAARAEEPGGLDTLRELGRAARADLPAEERLAAAQRALLAPGTAPAEAWRRAGVALMRAAPTTGAPLLRRALREGLGEEAVAALRRQALEWRAGPPGPPTGLALHATALAFLLGERGEFEGLTATWPPPPFVAQVLADELGVADAAASDPAALQARLRDAAPVLAELDRAAAADPAVSAAGMDALRARGEAALPTLLLAASHVAREAPPGPLLRGVQALTVLGVLGSRRATPTLLACLESPHGWVRFAAASALGDLADPAAAVALARQLAYAGDPFRARESWDYPGTSETRIAPEDWASVEYYVIDVAAADALLGLGVRGAAGWLIRNALDPTRRNLRVRVPQDALDALRRHLAAPAPLPDALVDGGLPQRWEAFERLEAWWRAHRDDPDLLRTRFAEDDPGFVREAQALAARLGQPKVLELMIAKDSAEILGGALTPSLAAALGQARSKGQKVSKVHQVELAAALARVRDPRAVDPLLALARDPTGFVRAAAALALGAYAAREPRVVQAQRALLDDEDCGTRVAALKGLAGAPRDPALLAALETHDVAAHAARCGADSDYAWAAAVLRLAQAGSAAWPAVEQGLSSPDRVVRRTVWDLLRVALDLPEHGFDPLPALDAPDRRPMDPALVKAALAARGLE